MVLIIIYLFTALGISFLCSILEAVLLSTPISFISMKESEGASSAVLLKKLKQNIDRPISAILSLNTIAHTIGAAGVGAEAVKMFGEVYFGIISAVLTLLILVFSEIIPKTIGANYWRSLCLPSAKVISAMIILCYPLVWLSELITKLITSKNNDVSVSREEVSAMVEIGAEEGVFHVKENKVIQNLIKFGDILITKIMTPRVVASLANDNLTVKEFYADKKYGYYSRIPVFSENRDFITGYVLRKGVLENLAEDKFDVQLKNIKRKIII